jgi:hypothetical protein
MLCSTFGKVPKTQKEKSAQNAKKIERRKTRKKKSYNKKGQPLFFHKKIEATHGLI